MKRWKIFKLFIVMCLTFSIILGSGNYLYAKEGRDLSYINENNTIENNIVGPQKRTKADIISFYQEHPYNMSQRVTYQEYPSFSPYMAGKLSDQTVTDGLNALNFVRFIAGIPADISIKEEYEIMAQTGSVVLAKNNQITHTPENIYNIPDEFFSIGYSGTSKSNIGEGYVNISNSIIDGYIPDKDISNIEQVGHRRWILNPYMKYTGFGYCNLQKNYTVLYAIDQSRNNYNISYVSWPAENMPYELMKGPWSISLSKEEFIINVDEVKVIMTDLKTGKEYILDNSIGQNSTKGYFNINEEYYGMGPAIIFDPSIRFSVGDQIYIQVIGLKDRNNSPTKIEYTVDIFSLNDNINEEVSQKVEAPRANIMGGTYKSNQNVILSSNTKGSTIYYTMDGSIPTESSKKYNSSIRLTGVKGECKTINIRAIAVKRGMKNSDVSSFSYTIDMLNMGYNVTIEEGRGSGTYEKGECVVISANTLESGKKFKNWAVVSGQVSILDKESPTTSFIMPERDVIIKAVYEKISEEPEKQKYTVAVTGGMGSGVYTVGSRVTIKADEPNLGMKFKNWKVVSGSVVLVNSRKENTSFIMPDENVIIEAIFEKKVSTNTEDDYYDSYDESNNSHNDYSMLDSYVAAETNRWGIFSTYMGNKFLKKNGIIAKNEWIKYQDHWYYAGTDEVLKTGWIHTADNKWYYLQNNGIMAIDWIFINNKWYYLNKENGDMAVGWKLIEDKWFYLDMINGDMAIGWKLIDNKWYYFCQDGTMATGWQYINSKWYYLRIQGDCIMDGMTPDGYIVDKNGAWIP